MRTRSLLPTLLAAAAVPLMLSGQSAAVPETPPAAAPAPAKAETRAAEAESKPATTVTKGKDTLSVDFPDEEIRTVLRNVADLFELNLVIPDTLQGKTSIKLRDVTWRQIFQVVLAPVGYTFIEDSNIIKIVSQESLNLEPLTTEVFILNYAKAGEVKPSLDALVDPKVGGKIVVDTRSNALVVTERASAIQRFRPIITSLDKATEQVMIETKFIEVTDSDIKNIGVNWASLSAYKIGTDGPITRKYESTNSVVNTNQHDAKNLDVPYMVNGYNKADQIFNNSNAPGVVVGPKLTTDPTTGTSSSADLGPASLLSNLFTNNITKVSSALFSADQFQLVLSALQTASKTKLVSNPTVVTLNNTEATIDIGEEYPIPNYTYNQEKGVFEVSGFTYKPIGVILKVTPQVNSTGFIKLTVEPEVSNRGDNVTFGGAGGAQIPVITVRKTKTQITLKDGYTLGIGGMVQDRTTKGQSKVPVLGDIPGLGRLFRSDSKDKASTNLLVFITARTLKPDGATTGDVFDPRMVRDMGIEKNELPGFRDGSDPFAQPLPAVNLKK
jgi:type IV pilus assembly protein PilQ